MNHQRLIKSITKNEGYVPTVYKDSLEIDTIGIGFAIKDLYLSIPVCEMILAEKLDALSKDINKRWPWLKDLPDLVQEVVYEMCYQMGPYGVSHFKMFLKALKAGNWKEAARQGLNSKWARSDSPGRAKKLMAIIRSM